MQVFLFLILGTFIVGGTSFGVWVRERPVVLVPLCVIAAASFYSLSVVLS